MKARVKESYYTSAFNEGEIVEIIPNMEADAADVFNVPAGKCFLCKKEDGTLKYIIATNLQLLSSDDNPDYWTRLEHQAAIVAMQGMLNNSLLITGLLKVNKSHEDIVAEVTGTAIRYAHTLVEKVRYEEKPKELEVLKRELEALKIEKTILENKVKLLNEERK